MPKWGHPVVFGSRSQCSQYWCYLKVFDARPFLDRCTERPKTVRPWSENKKCSQYVLNDLDKYPKMTDPMLKIQYLYELNRFSLFCFGQHLDKKDNWNLLKIAFHYNSKYCYNAMKSKYKQTEISNKQLHYVHVPIS